MLLRLFIGPTSKKSCDSRKRPSPTRRRMPRRRLRSSRRSSMMQLPWSVRNLKSTRRPRVRRARGNLNRMRLEAIRSRRLSRELMALPSLQLSSPAVASKLKRAMWVSSWQTNPPSNAKRLTRGKKSSTSTLRTPSFSPSTQRNYFLPKRTTTGKSLSNCL